MKKDQEERLRYEGNKEMVLQQLRRHSAANQQHWLLEMERSEHIDLFNARVQDSDFLEVDRHLVDVQEQLLSLHRKAEVNIMSSRQRYYDVVLTSFQCLSNVTCSWLLIV